MNKTTKENTLCWYPFHQIATKGWEKGIGPTAITPCCNMEKPTHVDPMNNKDAIYAAKGNFTPDDIFYGKEFEELRQSMLRGEKHPACDVCWKQEETTDYSYRLKNSNHQDEINTDNPLIKSIDLGTGEHCNLRCRMCNPGNSNKLRVDQAFFRENSMKYMTIENT